MIRRGGPSLLAGALLLVGGILVLLPGPVGAQGAEGEISGLVVSAEDGRPLAGATVLAGRTDRSAVTGEDGRFHLVGLPPGRYRLRVLHRGYRIEVVEDVVVPSREARDLEISLERHLVEIPTLVVTAGPGLERPGESPASVAVLEGTELSPRVTTSLLEALPFAPGVIVNAGQLDIRGASGLARGVGSRVLVLLDGHRILSPTTGGIDFDALPTLGVERVEIVKGPQSTLYGSNALGGVVNVISARIPNEPRSDVRIHYGTWDIPSRISFTDEHLAQRGVQFEHGRRVGGVGVSLFGERTTSDGFSQNGELDRRLLRARVTGGRGRPITWDAFLVWSEDTEGSFFTWRSPDRPLEVPSEAVGDRVERRKVRSGATISLATGGGGTITLRPILERSSVRNDFHDNQDFHRGTRFGTEVRTTLFPAGRHTTVVGAEASRTQVTSNILGEPALNDLAIFGQNDLAFSETLELSSGLRLDHHRAEGADAETTASPRLGLVYRPNEGTSLRFSVARGYRAPSATERFVSTTQGGFRVVPNPGLSGETVLSWEAGVTAELGRRIWLDGGAFHSRYRDLIEPAPVPDGFFTFQFRNVSEARVQGFDVGVRSSLIQGLLGWNVSYTFLDTVDRRLDLPLPYRSAHNVTSSLLVREGWITVDYRFRSRVERVLAFPLDPRRDIHLVDLRLIQPVGPILARVQVRNLLQREYVDVQERTPGAPRQFLFSLSAQF